MNPRGSGDWMRSSSYAAMSKRARQSVVVLIAAILLFGPALSVHFSAPSHRTIERRKCIKGGRARTANGSELDVYLVWGDVFRPKAIHRDMGFDLVCVSCYFDPIAVKRGKLLPSNPLLNSAIAASTDSEEELQYLLGNIFEALEKSKQVVGRFMSGGKALPGEGDQLVPFTWVAYRGSRMSSQQGVKYLAALPLFNPDLLFGRVSELETRKRLAVNVETVTRRTMDYASEDLDPTVHSVAFAALGSTSHRGGDSRYFLQFSEGFLSILRGIEQSRPTKHLDRAYLVAYDRHRDVFKEDALDALQEVKRQLVLKSLASSRLREVTGGSLGVLLFAFCLLSYRQYARIWRESNRWTFVATLLGFAGAAVGVSWFGALYAFEAFHLGSTGFVSTYLILTGLCLVAIRWMGKRLPRLSKTKPVH